METSGRHRGAACAVLVMCLVAAGCATPAGAVFGPVDKSLAWPNPTAPERIAYVGQLSSPADLKPSRSAWQRFTEVFAGRRPPAPMESPLDVTVADGHRVYVADPAAGCIHVFDLETRKYTRLGEKSGIKSPIAVAAGSTEIFVVDADKECVLRIGYDGKLLGRIGEGEIARPAAVCVSPADGSIVVTDAESHQVVRFAADGELLGRIGSRGDGAGQFNYPTFVYADGEGHIYVSDSLNFRLQVLGADGQFIEHIGSIGNRPGNLSLPKGVGVDSYGHIYLVDAHFENIQVFDREGRILLPFGSEGTGPGQFWLPAGLHVDELDRIWVADSYNHRVQVFRYIRESADATPE